MAKSCKNFAKRADLTDYAVESQDSAVNNLLVKLQYQIDDNHRVEFLAELIDDSVDSEIVHGSYDSYDSEDITKQKPFRD
ncbi:hypothetical protein QW180_28760 [Vibrio sinaloensis]|nr:hypothetical protein [Vibrio sinaloensis]